MILSAIVATVDAYMADPKMSDHAIGDGYVLDLTGAVLDFSR